MYYMHSIYDKKEHFFPLKICDSLIFVHCNTAQSPHFKILTPISYILKPKSVGKYKSMTDFHLTQFFRDPFNLKMEIGFCHAYLNISK